MKIIALTTCHNRRELTLRALDSLHRQSLPFDCNLLVCLVDDGSVDGTGDTVRAMFPDVAVLEGSGNLFWAGGMRFGWEKFAKHQDFDYLLVFNDDIMLYPDSIKNLLSAAMTVETSGCFAYAVAGAFKDPVTWKTTYGGLVHNGFCNPLIFEWIPPKEVIQDCDTLNMNFSLISSGALRRIGFLSKEFIHSKADFDFGLRLKAGGGRVVLAPGYVGETSRNSINGTSREPNIRFIERWRRLTGAKETSPWEWAVYTRRHAGFRWPYFWLNPYMRVCIKGMLQSLQAIVKRW